MTETLLVYDLNDVPQELTWRVPDTSLVRQRLFWAGRSHSKLVDELFGEIPEPDIEHVDEGLDTAMLVASAAAASHRFAERVRPEDVPQGGRIYGAFCGGFHTAERGPVEEWLRKHSTLVDIREVLSKVLVLRVTRGEDLVDSVMWTSHTVNAGSEEMFDELYCGPGFYGLDREDPAYESFEIYDGDADEPTRITLRIADCTDPVLHIDLDQGPNAVAFADLDFD